MFSRERQSGFQTSIIKRWKQLDDLSAVKSRREREGGEKNVKTTFTRWNDTENVYLREYSFMAAALKRNDLKSGCWLRPEEYAGV